MARKYRKFSPEFKDEAVKLVIDGSRPIAQVVRELGIHEGTLGNWVNQYRRDHAGDEPPLDIGERARLREAERELRGAPHGERVLEKSDHAGRRRHPGRMRICVAVRF